MLARMFAALVLLLAACPKGSTMKSPPPGGGSAVGSGTDPGAGSGTDPGAGSGTDPGAAVEAPAGPKLGEPCGPDDRCGEGACVSYRGIAGARGPEFKSCELRCDQGSCREGRKCITIADGPGQVCR